MQEIDSNPPTAEFRQCWEAAAKHIEERFLKQKGKENFARWMKFLPEPPFLEHLSFRLGNQLFFVFIGGADLTVPGTVDGLVWIAEACNGHPCILPMRLEKGHWQPTFATGKKSGLMNAITNEPVEPMALLTDEQIEMTDWEVHDFAVQIVRDKLREGGAKLLSWQGNPSVDPAIWFQSANGPEWVVVRAARYPALAAAPPASFLEIYKGCAPRSERGHFASVVVANAKDSFDKHNHVPVPLWRGDALRAKYDLKTASDTERAYFQSARQ